MSKNILKTIGKWIVTNKSNILLVEQAVAIPLIAVTAACAVPSYEQERKDLMDEVHDDLTWGEELKIFGKHFWKTGALVVVTEASVFAKDKWGKEHIAALTALAVTRENEIKEIKESIVKTVGEKKAEEIDQTRANCKKSTNESDLDDLVNAQITDSEKPWIWQDLRFDTGYFLATQKRVESACQYVKDQVREGEVVLAGELKEKIKSKSNRECEYCGWGRTDQGPNYGVPRFKTDGVKQLSDGTIIHLLDYDITYVDGEALSEAEYD